MPKTPLDASPQISITCLAFHITRIPAKYVRLHTPKNTVIVEVASQIRKAVRP